MRRAAATLGAAALSIGLAACGRVEPPAGSAPDGGGAIADGRAGVDFSWDRPSPDGLRAAGYAFAVRYLSYDTTGKNLTALEASGLVAAGIAVAAVWENGTADALDGNARGASDAQEAARQAAADGMPDGRPIYFAIDFDASVDQQAALDDYFEGVASVLGVARTGAYGGIGPLGRLLDAGKISWAWQTTAWSNGQWEPRAQLRQTRHDIEIAGGDCDVDEAEVDDVGQWRIAQAP